MIDNDYIIEHNEKLIIQRYASNSISINLTCIRKFLNYFEGRNIKSANNMDIQVFITYLFLTFRNQE
jgi:hypothetical protein